MFDNLRLQWSNMGESWDDDYWDTDGQVREWYVEYIAVVNEQKYHHMTVLYGEGMQDVQKRLLQEVRDTYRSSDRIDITVVKMKETDYDPDSAKFEGLFVP